MVLTCDPLNTSNSMKKLTNILCEYVENSSIHGFRYLAERNRSTFEKIFWVVIFLLSIFACCFSVQNQWNKWNENPVVLTFNTKPQDICRIPFPAITICPLMKFETGDFNFREIYANLQHLIKNSSFYERDIVEKLIALTQICPVSDIFLRLRNMRTNLDEDFDIVETLLNLNYYQFIRIIKFERFVPDFHFARHFAETVTDQGICYTFNILNGSDIFTNHTIYNEYENHYNLNHFTNVELKYPFHSVLAGKQGGFKFDIYVHPQYDQFICEPFVEGYKLMIHPNDEYPNFIDHSYINVPHNYKIELAIKPKVVQSSNDIKYLKLKHRQCYLPGERNLLYYKTYTQKNCEHECLANLTIKLCNCTRFFMPRLQHMRICASNEIYCYEMANDEILYAKTTPNSIVDCNCLPSCSTIHYDTEKYITAIDVENAINMTNILMNMNSTKINQIYVNQFSIYFKESQFIALQRSEFYGWTDFLGNFGGLFGLFMGVSLLSFIEIFYFFIIRTLCN